MDRWGLGRDKENGVERNRHQSGLTKRYKKMDVDKQEIKGDIGQYTMDKFSLPLCI